MNIFTVVVCLFDVLFMVRASEVCRQLSDVGSKTGPDLWGDLNVI